MRVLHNGQMVDCQSVGFQASEKWTEVLCDNGVVIRVKVVITQVLHIPGVTDQSTGQPIYIAQCQPVFAVNVP